MFLPRVLQASRRSLQIQHKFYHKCRFASTSARQISNTDFILVNTNPHQPLHDGHEQKEEEEGYVESLIPTKVVEHLDKYIVGQYDAKKAVAVALRNRWRRQKLPKKLREEVLPMNILMIGPTGTGKTEIARRLSKFVKAPFVKVEATKYTEIGVFGTNTDQCIKDLVENAFKMEMEIQREKHQIRIRNNVEDKILRQLPGLDKEERVLDRARLRNGEFDDYIVYVDEMKHKSPGRDMFGLGGQQVPNVKKILQAFQVETDAPKRRKMKVVEAIPILEEIEASKVIDEQEIGNLAVKRAEESGIVFIDEIDKLSSAKEKTGSSVFREKGEGVQKELLSLVEGSIVQTDYGSVQTEHILFIGSGAFHQSKPSDLLPELQGRLPTRVKLDALTAGDFVRILTETEFNLIEQQIALLQTEGIKLTFTDGAIKAIAEMCYNINQNVENIGARRLRAIISKVIEDLSFEAPLRPNSGELIDEEYVQTKLKNVIRNTDLSKYIL